MDYADELYQALQARNDHRAERDGRGRPNGMPAGRAAPHEFAEEE